MKPINKTACVAAFALALTAFSAGAADDCTKDDAMSRIEVLQITIKKSNEFLGNGAQRAQDGLEAKAMTAGGKVEVNKFDDALQKLEEIVLKVEDLTGAPKPKLSDFGAEQIGGAAMSAMDCVVQL